MQPARQLTPFLCLKSRLCLVWLSPSILALIFVIARLWVNASDVSSRVALAKASMLQNCQSLEQNYSHLLSWSHFAADGANRRTQLAVEGTVQACGHILMLR